MQTFLPYADFTKSAACLDNKRLGKQRVECLQIMKALSDPSYGWQNHPAVKMWRGYEHVLYHSYMTAVMAEWFRRGYKDTCYEKACLIYKQTNWGWQGLNMNVPWITDALCASHRSNLLRKDPVHYGQFGWSEPPTLPYIWPTNIQA